jgi:acyl carrier protein
VPLWRLLKVMETKKMILMQEKFITLLQEAFEMEDASIQMNDKFRDYPEWGSLSRLSLIAMLDDEFDITIEDEVFKTLITIEDLYNEVLKRKG